MPFHRSKTLFDAIDDYGHDLDYEPLLEPLPTATRPGSAERLQVYQSRLERGESLYHPNDDNMAANRRAEIFMVEFAKASAKEIRNARRAAKAEDCFSNANLAKQRMREMRLGR